MLPIQKINRWLLAISCGLTALFVIVFLLANRYLIPHYEQLTLPDEVLSDLSSQFSSSSATASVSSSSASVEPVEEIFTDTQFYNGDIDIRLETVTLGSGDEQVIYHAAYVTLSDASYLQSAFAYGKFGRNMIEPTSDIALDNGAILAINGDYFGFRDNGIEIRNGELYRDNGVRTGAVIYRDGRMEFYDETTTDALDLLRDGALHTMSFGPVLVEDGKAVESFGIVNVDTNVGNGPIQNRNPRTAIGYYGPCEYVFVVVDGRSNGYSRGVTLVELAAIMEDLGVTLAYNLDGGGSSTLYFGGEVVSRPVRGQERGTSDIFYIGQ